MDQQQARKSFQFKLNYEELVENINDGLTVQNEFGILLFVNTQFCSITGYSKEEVLGHDAREFIKPEDLEKITFQMKQREANVHHPYELTLLHKDGREIQVLLSPKARFDKTGKFIGSVSIITDISAMKESQEKYQTLFNEALIGIGLSDFQGRIFEANPYIKKIMKITDEELTHTSAYDYHLHQEDPKQILELLQQNGSVSNFETLFKTKDGNLPFLLDLHPITIQGESRLLICIRDISYIKKIETDLKRALKEKKILLEELQHRIKNNFTTIQSILSIQEITDPECKKCDQLKKLSSRIAAFALGNRLLELSKSQIHIDSRIYFEQLINQIKKQYPTPSPVTIQTELHVTTMDTKTAINCGLVLNEILTNSFKYAFTDGRDGVISISTKHQQNEIQLNVRDNGVGFPSDFQPDQDATMGMTLIHSIIKDQLDGKVRYKNNSGVHYEIRIPLNTQDLNCSETF
jgi:PAS domain S-box-containing protein